MTNRRDIVILAGLLAALVLFVAFGPSSRPPAEPDRPTTHSGEPAGALALYEWLRAAGYDARRLEYREFALMDEDHALVLLSPSEPVSRADATATLEWVARGGTLILADDTSAFGARNALLDELDVAVEVYSSTLTIDEAAPLQPALDQPPVGTAAVHAERVLVPARDDLAPLLGTPDALLVAGLRYGQGYIYLSATAHPFTNAGLEDEQNAALVLNMLRRVPAGGRVLFDEIHHGFVTPPSTQGALLSTPWGWAGLYVALVVSAYLALTGRRFGRPLPLAEERARRTSSEYVDSMADLFQRGGKRGYILEHYRRTFKRRLARAAGINPNQDDEAFVRELANAQGVDEQQVAALLARLRIADGDEAAMLRVVAEADAFLAEGPGRA
jgi:hypothetical protein